MVEHEQERLAYEDSWKAIFAGVVMMIVMNYDFFIGLAALTVWSLWKRSKAFWIATLATYVVMIPLGLTDLILLWSSRMWDRIF